MTNLKAHSVGIRTYSAQVMRVHNVNLKAVTQQSLKVHDISLRSVPIAAPSKIKVHSVNLKVANNSYIKFPVNLVPLTRNKASALFQPDGYVPGWGYPTFFEDKFDYKNPSTGLPAMNPAKWNIRKRADLGLLFDVAIPDENQITTDINGICHIKGQWLPDVVQRPSGQTGPPLTHKTGYMDHRVLNAGNIGLSQRYGRWEIRAKVPVGQYTLGTLAAFWLRNGLSGEIDIMESWGYGDSPRTTPDGGQKPGTSTITFHSHTGTVPAGETYVKTFWNYETVLKNRDGVTRPPVDLAYHVWAYEMTPNYIAAYRDGELIMNVTPTSHPQLWDTRYMNSPWHLRVNLHIGPNETYWGLPKVANPEWTLDSKTDFLIDYIRVWPYTP